MQDKYDKATADAVEWSAPRLICIAADFSKFDAHAVKQMSRNIELIRYRQFEGDLLMLDLLTTVSTKPMRMADPVKGKSQKYKTNAQSLSDANDTLSNLYSDIEAHMMGLGDDVVQKELQNYFAFKRIKNFACVEVHKQTGDIRVYVKVNPDSIKREKGFTRDVRKVGHFGTGDRDRCQRFSHL